MDIILVLFLAFVTVGLLIAANQWRASRQAESRAGADDGAAWLRRARDAAIEGQRVVNLLDGFDYSEHRAVPVELDDTAIDEAIERLDSLSSLMSQVSSTAPTAMDARVCRSVAVSATTLVEDLRSEGNERRRHEAVDSPTGHYARHVVEFELAVRDLRSHVELL